MATNSQPPQVYRKKPALAPKSQVVLAVAEETRKLRLKHTRETASDSEIYDDVITRRDDLYDDIISTTTGIPQLRKDSFKQVSCEDIYDDILVCRLQEGSEIRDLGAPPHLTKPHTPRKTTRLYRHPKVIELPQQLDEKQIDIDEIYDDVLSGFHNINGQLKSQRASNSGDNPTLSTGKVSISTTTSHNTHRNNHDLHVHRTEVARPLDDIPSEDQHALEPTRNLSQNQGMKTECTEATIPLPPQRRRCDPLPEIQELPRLVSVSVVSDSCDSADQYEQLPLYEDVDIYQNSNIKNDTYQDPVDVVIKALDLPDTIRERSTRMTRGKRTRLRKRIKKNLRRTQNVNSSEVIAPLLAGNDPPLSHTSDHISSGDEGDEEGPIPFGKSRVVFDMLLDASGIERSPDKPTFVSQTDESKEDGPQENPLNEDQNDTHKYQDYFDTTQLLRLHDDPEIKRHQEAGILQLRTHQEIAEDIEQLVASAPPEPPPLPGIQRPRARALTRTDKIVHKRYIMKKSQTLCTIHPEQTTLSNRQTSMPGVAFERVPLHSYQPPTKPHETCVKDDSHCHKTLVANNHFKAVQ